MVLIKRCVSLVMPRMAITHVVTIARSVAAIVNEVLCRVLTVETTISEMSFAYFAIIDLERTTWMSTIERLQ